MWRRVCIEVLRTEEAGGVCGCVRVRVCLAHTASQTQAI